MPRINAKSLVTRALKREGGKKQVDVAQAMELFGAICFEIEEVSHNPYETDEIIYLIARSYARRRKIDVEW